MVGHARWLMWEGYNGYLQHTNQYSFAAKLGVYFFSLFKYGHEMVLFFFVLSGFVIHLRYAKQIASGNTNSSFDLIPYIKRRARRIYPPLIAAVVLGFLLDYTGKYLGYSIYNNATPYPLINNNIHIDFTVTNLLGNLFFLQNTYVPVWGSNTPLWSLKFEWWFYMLYPLLYLMNKKHVWLSVLVVCTLSVVLSSGYLMLPNQLLQEVLSALFCWWLGTLLADIYVKRVQLSFLYFIPFILLLGGIPVMMHYVPLYKDIFCALGFFGLLSGLFYVQSKGVRLLFLEKLHLLGSFSYTLYILHFPMLVFMSGYLLYRHNNQLPQVQQYIWLAIVLCTLIAYLLHFITEKWVLNTTYKKSNTSTVLPAE